MKYNRIIMDDCIMNNKQYTYQLKKNSNSIYFYLPWAVSISPGTLGGRGEKTGEILICQNIAINIKVFVICY